VNCGVEDFLQLAPRRGIGEDEASHFLPVQATVGIHESLTKCHLDLLQSGLPWLDHLARDEVGIDHGDAAVCEEVRRGAFSHAYAAREAKSSHRIHNLRPQVSHSTTLGCAGHGKVGWTAR
jgi:hypothetical protein